MQDDRNKLLPPKKIRNIYSFSIRYVIRWCGLQYSTFEARFLNMHIFFPSVRAKHAYDMQQLCSNEYNPLLHRCISFLTFSARNENTFRL